MSFRHIFIIFRLHWYEFEYHGIVTVNHHKNECIFHKLIFEYFQIPNHFVWLCFFYLSFHSFLNLIGELLHFADRNFYCDWWNANNIDTFWRTWNMPVHRWCVRHVYIPVVDMGYSRTAASLIVFFISAFFHEYLVSRLNFCVNLRLSPDRNDFSSFLEVLPYEIDEKKTYNEDLWHRFDFFGNEYLTSKTFHSIFLRKCFRVRRD